MIPTIVAPMTYENIGYTDMNFLDKVAEKFGGIRKMLYLFTRNSEMMLTAKK